MDYLAAVRETWRHHDLGDAKDDYRGLVRYATLAASSHNTQPWKFRLGRDRIQILPDLSRRCPEVDPDDHHLYASLGCATANLLLAARCCGLKGHFSCQALDQQETGVQVDLEEAGPTRSELFEAIPSRQCSRSEYDGSALSADELRLLETAADGNGVSIMLLTRRQQMAQIAEYVAEGNTEQFGDPGWVEEMQKWIRFSAREAVRSRDGLYGPVMGSPSVPNWLGKLVMRFAFSAKRQNRKDIKNIMSSAAIAVLYSEADDQRHWIEAGRCYQRLALQATALNLHTAFINQPVEVSTLRPQFASYLGIGHRRPDLLVRVGRGAEMPRSLRRPVEAVVL